MVTVIVMSVLCKIRPDELQLTQSDGQACYSEC